MSTNEHAPVFKGGIVWQEATPQPSIAGRILDNVIDYFHDHFNDEQPPLFEMRTARVEVPTFATGAIMDVAALDSGGTTRVTYLPRQRRY